MKRLILALMLGLLSFAAPAREGQMIVPKRIQITIQVPPKTFDPAAEPDAPNVSVKMEFRLDSEGSLSLRAYLSGKDRFFSSDLVKKVSREQIQHIETDLHIQSVRDVFEMDGRIFAALYGHTLKGYWVDSDPKPITTLVELVPKMGLAPNDGFIFLKTLPWPLLGLTSDFVLGSYFPQLSGFETIGGLIAGLITLNWNCQDAAKACQAQLKSKKLKALRWAGQVLKVESFVKDENGLTTDAWVVTKKHPESILFSEILKPEDCAARLMPAAS